MDLEKKEKVLGRLHEDVNLCKDYLNTVHAEVVKNGISNYPIFVASQVPVELGKLIIDKKELDIEWSFYASHLEEFAIKEIVKEDKVPEFTKLYKERKDEFCMFVFLEDEFNFVFLPKK